MSALLWSLHFLLIGGVRPPVIPNDGLILYPGGNQSPLLNESWWEKQRSDFFTTGRTLLYQEADCVSSEQMNRITFQSKAQVFNCCRKLSFCLHNTLTCVCFILAPRQDVISTPTSPHWIADEIKLLTKEMCFALSSSLSHFFLPCLWTAWWIFYIQA